MSAPGLRDIIYRAERVVSKAEEGARAGASREADVDALLAETAAYTRPRPLCESPVSLPRSQRSAQTKRASTLCKRGWFTSGDVRCFRDVREGLSHTRITQVHGDGAPGLRATGGAARGSAAARADEPVLL